MPASSRARFVDVYYEDLMAQLVAQMRRIYDAAGLEWSEAVEARMGEYLADNRQHKHGRHRYRLEDFGLRDEDVAEAFEPYFGRYPRLRG